MLRLLATHPDFKIGALTANSSAGTLLGQHHPHLRSLADREIHATTTENLAGHDVVVLALPHGHSGEIAARLPDDVIVVDLGADHRLTSASDWNAYYGSDYADSWPYGMPELITGSDGARQRDNLTDVKRIAVPGCNVTAVTLGIQPAVTAGLINQAAITAVLAVGYSGAGKALKPHLTAAEAFGSAQPYAVGGTHRHIPEIIQNLNTAGGEDIKLSFTPVLVPMSRGILATITAPLSDAAKALTQDEIVTIWRETYANEPFVQMLPDGQWPTSGMTTGANTALIQVTVDERAGTLVVISAIDNVVKGTAGQALQALNIALGLDETTGLTVEGVAP